MMPASRSSDRGFWLVCLVGGALVALGCALPTIEIGQGASVGAALAYLLLKAFEGLE